MNSASEKFSVVKGYSVISPNTQPLSSIGIWIDIWRRRERFFLHLCYSLHGSKYLRYRKIANIPSYFCCGWIHSCFCLNSPVPFSFFWLKMVWWDLVPPPIHSAVTAPRVILFYCISTEWIFVYFPPEGTSILCVFQQCTYLTGQGQGLNLLLYMDQHIRSILLRRRLRRVYLAY